jgi:hypothetical protein
MALWGKTVDTEARPKSLPNDSNSSYSREFVTATAKGWVFQPGTASAATGNDNASADPEILVAIRNLSSTQLRSANLLSIDWTDGAYADAADFDLVLTFDENITVTSAAATANNTITNKVFITLSELGATDMVQDNTVNCQYKSGSGTNTLTFRGRLNTTANGFLSFTDNFIHVNGTATMQADSETFSGILSETAAANGTDNSIVLDASSGASGTVNGALTASTTVTVDGVSGTIAVGQVVTVNGAGSTPAASITATEDSDTGISTDNTLTITAVASQTSFTVSEPITVADNINLLFSADAGEGIEQNSISMLIEGADGATSVIGTQAYRTGFGVDTLDGRIGLLEDGDGKIQLESSADGIQAEEFTTDADGLVVETQSGSASGSASIIKGVTTT